MYLPLHKVLGLYDDLTEAKLSQKPIRISVPALKLGLDKSMDDELTDKKYAEDFHSICHIFNSKHGTEIKVDGLEAYKWLKMVRNGKMAFNGKLKVEVIKKEK